MEVTIKLRKDKRTKNFDRYVAVQSFEHAEGTIYLPTELKGPEEIVARIEIPS